MNKPIIKGTMSVEKPFPLRWFKKHRAKPTPFLRKRIPVITFSYQWYRSEDKTPIDGATCPSYQIQHPNEQVYCDTIVNRKWRYIK